MRVNGKLDIKIYLFLVLLIIWIKSVIIVLLTLVYIMNNTFPPPLLPNNKNKPYSTVRLLRKSVCIIEIRRYWLTFMQIKLSRYKKLIIFF